MGQMWEFTVQNLDAVAMMGGAAVLLLVAVVLAVARFGHGRQGSDDGELLRLR